MVGKRGICGLKNHSQYINGCKYMIGKWEKIFTIQNKVKVHRSLVAGELWRGTLAPTWGDFPGGSADEDLVNSNKSRSQEEESWPVIFMFIKRGMDFFFFEGWETSRSASYFQI